MQVERESRDFDVRSLGPGLYCKGSVAGLIKDASLSIVGDTLYGGVSKFAYYATAVGNADLAFPEDEIVNFDLNLSWEDWKVVRAAATLYVRLRVETFAVIGKVTVGFGRNSIEEKAVA